MHKVLVWYDGGCPLCRREIGFMRRLDRRGRVNFVDVASGDVDRHIDLARPLARFDALEDGQILSGAAAFAAMWRAIPALRPIGLAARRPLVLGVIERLYGGFLRVRPRLQQLLAE